jgi:hypothetical protein
MKRTQVVVEHVLHNRGAQPIELAPWAITQMKTLGGEAILPLAAPAADCIRVLPNRKLAVALFRPGQCERAVWEAPAAYPGKDGQQ